jgi:hypothetical protein
MCGYVATNYSFLSNVQVKAAMSMLTHRGPDSEGYKKIETI